MRGSSVVRGCPPTPLNVPPVVFGNAVPRVSVLASAVWCQLVDI